VAAIRLNLDLKVVRVRGTYSCRAVLESLAENPHKGILTADPADEARDAVYTLAGESAELALDPEKLVDDCLSASDREYFQALRPGEVNYQELQEWRCEMKRQSDLLVTLNWIAILRVARALLKRGRLGRSDVQRAIDDCTSC
jgi:hypothetical protein